MADLDELGFVASPHTSAGRIPTTRGYRYFVDALLSPERLSDEENALIADELLPGNRSEADLVEAASNLLSEMSQKIGRAHVCTPVTNAHLVCRLLIEKKIVYAPL